MCSGGFRNVSKGKNYSKTKQVIASLICKKRENRRKKCPSVFLDASLNNSILSLRNHLKARKQNCSSQRQKVEVNITTREKEIENLLNIDSFFKELDSIKVVNKLKSTENVAQPIPKKFDYDTDDKINDLLTNFIENGIVEFEDSV